MKNEKGITLMTLLIIVIIIIALAMILSRLGNSNPETKSTLSTSMTTSSLSTSTTNLQKNKLYGLGDTILFDGLQLTFDTTYSFDSVKNEFSEFNGRSVVKLGVTVKNVSSEKNSLNMFYYSLFGSKGTELNGVAAYFDDVIDFAGDLKPGASYKSYFYILYDGNGKYSIDFDNYKQELSVEFNVTK